MRTNLKTAKAAQAILGLSLMVLMLGTVGCKKSSNDNSQQVAGRSARQGSGVIPNQQVNPQTGQVFTTQTAYVSTDANNGPAFQDALKSLVSGQLDPQFLGYTSPSEGVIIRAYIEVDQQGRVVPQNSRMSLEIRDQLSNQIDASGNRVPPITITLPATSGYAMNGQVQIMFQDSIGRIDIYGSYQNGGALSGQVWFANNRKFDGSNVSSQLMALGNFQMQTCGFFKCN